MHRCSMSCFVTHFPFSCLLEICQASQHDNKKLSRSFSHSITSTLSATIALVQPHKSCFSSQCALAMNLNGFFASSWNLRNGARVENGQRMIFSLYAANQSENVITLKHVMLWKALRLHEVFLGLPACNFVCSVWGFAVLCFLVLRGAAEFKCFIVLLGFLSKRLFVVFSRHVNILKIINTPP